MNGVELSQAEKDAVLEVVDLRETVLSMTAEMSIEECSPELLSAIAKLKAGASANGLGLSPSGDLSRPGQKRRPSASGSDKPAGTRVGKRVKPEDVERLCHELRAHFAQNEGETFTGPQLARIVDVHDHHSGLFKAAIELLIGGKHVSIVGKWRNGPVYGAYVEDPDGDEVTRPTAGSAEAARDEDEDREAERVRTSALVPESSARTSALVREEPSVPDEFDDEADEEEADDAELDGAEEALQDLDEDMPLAERIVLLVEARGPLRASAIATILGKAPSTIDLIIRNDLIERLQNGASGWELRV